MFVVRVSSLQQIKTKTRIRFNKQNWREPPDQYVFSKEATLRPYRFPIHFRLKEHNMLLSSIFAVAVGLLILWIVLSFATIQIQEWVGIRLNIRARIIEDSINEMLANPNLKAQFYDHPVIRGLTAKKRKSHRSSRPDFTIFPWSVASLEKRENCHLIYLRNNSRLRSLTS